MSKITIVDYGMGNLLSIKNMIRKVGGEADIESDANKIALADVLILPGVGHFGRAMELINNSKIRNVLDEHVLSQKKPILGICLGMQLLFGSSEEGNAEGLGYINGKITKFSTDNPLFKVPHMGWNEVKPVRENHLISREGNTPRFYFVHSYFANCDDPQDEIGRTTYGHEFCSAVEKGHIAGVQFHPEKSHKFGMSLFQNYIEYIQ